jgi:c-di-GMP-binding flagellar brake protein YcgR
MFEKLRQVILGKGNHGEAEQSHTLTAPLEIVHLLQQAYKKHILLNASFHGQDERFSTTFLGIYEPHGFLVLDELTPAPGHELFLEQKEISLFGRLEGVELRFNCRLIEAREKNGIAFYKASIPEKVHHLQRRLDHRIPTRGQKMSFHAFRGLGDRQLIRGYVSNLSRKGVGVVIEENVSLHPGEILPSCTIRLPEIGDVNFSLEVRYCSGSHAHRTTRLGGRYKSLDQVPQQKIRKTIGRLERIQARQLHSG